MNTQFILQGIVVFVVIGAVLYSAYEATRDTRPKDDK